MTRGNLTITVARKPIAEGSVTRNALKWGAGGLDIDGSRIQGGPKVVAPQSDPTKREGVVGSDWGISNTEREKFQTIQAESVDRTNTLGRWPPNVILVHKAGCQKVGTKQVPGHTGYPNGPGGKSMHYSDQKSRGQDVRPNPWAGYANEDGLETVDDWQCVDGCPVAELDRQTMGMHGAGYAREGDFGGEYLATSYAIQGPRSMGRFGDTGGASRFFFQVQEDAE